MTKNSAFTVTGKKPSFGRPPSSQIAKPAGMHRYLALPLDGADVADVLGAQSWLIAKPFPCVAAPASKCCHRVQVTARIFHGTGFKMGG